jgi:hypothetical protein
MARIVFLVHGMGDQPPDWSTSVKAKLDEVAARYAAFRNGQPLSQRVELVEIDYDSVFDQHVNDFAGDFANLEQFAQQAGRSLGKIANWFPNADASQRGFFWTHVVDVLLYHGFNLVRDEVRVKVMQQFAHKLTSSMQGGRIVDAFVIAHSLGTGVTCDTLALLGSQAFNGSSAFLAGRGMQFKGIFTIANVAKEVATDIDPYTSVLHPDSAVVNPASSAYCARFANFRHVLDPFCRLTPFAPPNWGGDFNSVEDLKHVHDLNVHGFEHYLDHPKVHIPIINGIFETPIITSQERADAIRDYPAIAGECNAELLAMQTFIQGLDAPKDTQELVIGGAEFLARAQALKEQCKGVVATLAAGLPRRGAAPRPGG